MGNQNSRSDDDDDARGRSPQSLDAMLPPWARALPRRNVMLVPDDAAGTTPRKYGPFVMFEVPPKRGGGLVFLVHPNCAETNGFAGRGCLRVANNGRVNCRGAGGPWARFTPAPGDAPDSRRLVAQRSQRSLRSDPRAGMLVGVAQGKPGTSFRFHEVADDAITPGAATFSLGGTVDWDPSAALSAEQYRSFVSEGYLVLRGVVPPAVVKEARRTINSALIQPGSVARREDGGGIQSCPSTGSAPEVLACLRNTGLWTYCQRLLGRGKASPVGGCQIALRGPSPFPKWDPADTEALAPSVLSQELPGHRWHIDGMGKGKHSPFSLLVGVALSDQRLPFSGNLIVFPGSHHRLHPLLREQVMSGSGLFSDEMDGTKPVLANPTNVLLAPGDVVIAHQKLAHRVGPNFSADVRYQLYFRVRHAEHERMVVSGQVLDDLWCECEGVKQASAAAAAAPAPAAAAAAASQ